MKPPLTYGDHLAQFSLISAQCSSQKQAVACRNIVRPELGPVLSSPIPFAVGFDAHILLRPRILSSSAATEVGGYLIKGDFDRTNDCGILSAGGTCTVKVTFTPLKKGAQSGSIQILTPQDKVQVSLKGSGK